MKLLDKIIIAILFLGILSLLIAFSNPFFLAFSIAGFSLLFFTIPLFQFSAILLFSGFAVAGYFITGASKKPLRAKIIYFISLLVFVPIFCLATHLLFNKYVEVITPFVNRHTHINKAEITSDDNSLKLKYGMNFPWLFMPYRMFSPEIKIWIQPTFTCNETSKHDLTLQHFNFYNEKRSRERIWSIHFQRKLFWLVPYVFIGKEKFWPNYEKKEKSICYHRKELEKFQQDFTQITSKDFSICGSSSYISWSEDGLNPKAIKGETDGKTEIFNTRKNREELARFVTSTFPESLEKEGLVYNKFESDERFACYSDKEYYLKILKTRNQN